MITRGDRPTSGWEALMPVTNTKENKMRPIPPRAQKQDNTTRAVLDTAPVARQTFHRRDEIEAAQRRCQICVERLLLNRGLCPRCDPDGYR